MVIEVGKSIVTEDALRKATADKVMAVAQGGVDFDASLKSEAFRTKINNTVGEAVSKGEKLEIELDVRNAEGNLTADQLKVIQTIREDLMKKDVVLSVSHMNLESKLAARAESMPERNLSTDQEARNAQIAEKGELAQEEQEQEKLEAEAQAEKELAETEKVELASKKQDEQDEDANAARIEASSA